MRTILIALLLAASSAEAVAQSPNSPRSVRFGGFWVDPVTGNQICETTVSNEAPLLRGCNVCPFPYDALEATHPAIEADKNALENALKQLQSYSETHDISAIAADQTAIMTALAKLQADSAALHAALKTNMLVQASMAVVVADVQAMERDRVALCADKIVGATATADKQALLTELARLISDLTALRSAIAAVQF